MNPSIKSCHNPESAFYLKFALQILVIVCVLGSLSCNSKTQSEGTKETTLASDSLIILEHSSKIWNNTRGVRVLLPKGYYDAGNQTRYPVLYLNDGFAVIKHWEANNTISKLRKDNIISPFILVAIDNAIIDETNFDARTNEYLPYPDSTEPSIPNPQGEKYPDFLLNEVMPLINNNFRTLTDLQSTGLGGSSYGAYIALYTMTKFPDKFGMLLLESTPLFISDYRILNELDSLTTRPAKISIGIGDNEIPGSDQNVQIIKDQELFKDQLQLIDPQTEVQLIIGKNASHNSKAWKERFSKHILFLFGKDKTN